MSIIYAKDFTDYADVAAMAADGWTFNGTPPLQSTGGPFGSGDKYMRFTDSGSSDITRSITIPNNGTVRMACWIRVVEPGEFGNDLDGITSSFMQLMEGATVKWGMGVGASLRCPEQFDDATHAMGGVRKANDGNWHHAELYLRVSDTVGLVYLWLDGILIWQTYIDTNDSTFDLSIINNLRLQHTDFEAGQSVNQFDVAHPVVWNDVESSNSVNDLIGPIGPHRVDAGGASVTLGIVPPNASPEVFAIDLISQSFATSGEFTVTFPDMQAAGENLLICLGFSNAADADDTVTAGASFNSTLNLMTKGGQNGTTKHVDGASSGSGANRVHREGYFYDADNTGDDVLAVVSVAGGVSSSVGIVEIGSGNIWTSNKADVGTWTLNGSTVTGPGLTYDVLGIPNEMLENHFRRSIALSTDPTDMPVGFEPDIVFVLGVNDSDNATGAAFFSHCFGIYANMPGGAQQRMISWGVQGTSTAANNDFYAEIADDKVHEQIDATNGTRTYTGSMSQVDAETLRLDLSATNTDVVTMVGFKLNNGRKFHLGDLNTPTVTGDQAITGLGFKPGVVLMFLIDGTTALNTVGTNAASGIANSILMDDLQRTMNFSVDPDVSPTIAKSYRSAKAVKFYDAIAAAVTLEASLVSFDADGFTLNWTTVKGSSNRAFFLAIEDDVAESSNSLDSNSNSNDVATVDSMPIFFLAAA